MTTHSRKWLRTSSGRPAQQDRRSGFRVLSHRVKVVFLYSSLLACVGLPGVDPSGSVVITAERRFRSPECSRRDVQSVIDVLAEKLSGRNLLIRYGRGRITESGVSPSYTLLVNSESIREMEQLLELFDHPCGTDPLVLHFHESANDTWRNGTPCSSLEDCLDRGPIQP
jgi:hypothetical protein